MKKLDKLVLQAFLGPFLLTFAVVVFILLTQTIMKYFDELVGKGLGPEVFAELMFYFSLNVTPVALPLAVLLSSLMAFGNLGEHFELTAIKSAGISLVRVLRPIFLVSVLVTGGAFLFNNYVVPFANLRAFSLLYDIRTKKATLNLKEGIFYNDLPGYSIKANKKFPDGQTLKELIIYNHSENNGNKQVILADSGRMRTVMNDRYLQLELFDGSNYQDQVASSNGNNPDEFVRNRFRYSKMMFDMSSFDIKDTDENLFKHNRMMKNVAELTYVKDSITREYATSTKFLLAGTDQYYSYHLKKPPPHYWRIAYSRWGDSLACLTLLPQYRQDVLSRATGAARNIRTYTESQQLRRSSLLSEERLIAVERYRKFTQSAACLIMFLIGAPLGAIIKKGGLGVPVLVSIVFFIIFYVFSILGEKWAKESVVYVPYGAWGANFILLVVGLLFLRQARNDSRLFESDVYVAAFNRLWGRLRRLR